MATIQVYKHNTDILLGKGNGSIDTKAQTATIVQWTDKPGLQVDKPYKLKSQRRTYPDSNCTAVGLPAEFDNVV